MSKSASKSLIELTELTSIVARFGSKKNLDRLRKSPNLIGRLYSVISGFSSAPDDSEVMKAAGIGSDTPENRRRYQFLLAKLHAELLPEFIDLDLSREGYSEYVQKLYYVNRAVFLSRTFTVLGAPNAAVALSKRALKVAVEVEMWSSAALLSRLLRSRASLEGDGKSYEEYIQGYWRFTKLSAFEEEAKEAIERIHLVISRSAAEHPELLSEIRNAITRLEPGVREFGTFKLQELLLELRRMAAQSEMDYAETLAACDAGVQLLKDFPIFSNNMRRAKLAKSRMVSLVQLRKYAEAERASETCEKLFQSQSPNWYYFKEWQFILLMHTGEFEGAYQLCISIQDDKNFSAQTAPQHDKWTLFQLYADFFSGRNVPGGTRREHEVSGDLLSGLLQLLPQLQGDRDGYRFSAAVLEILILLRRGEAVNAVADRIEALARYKSRRLKGAHNTDSDRFIALLGLLPRYAFDPAKIEQKAKPLLAEMKASTSIDSLQSLQVLPYRKLWEEAIRGIKIRKTSARGASRAKRR
jgi:hypothetical protein